MSSLHQLVEDPATPIEAIDALLDELSPTARWGALAELDRGQQRLLYEKAAHAPAVELDHFVADAAPGREVVHEGSNTLPLPPMRRFQKIFCRVAGDDARLFGFNEGPSRRLIGPGYFVARPTAGRPAWAARGAVVVDYYEVPDGPVADGWPRVVANDHGLQRFVFHQTRDFMRRVSRHVSIGAAYKRERPLDHYFVLCRAA